MRAAIIAMTVTLALACQGCATSTAYTDRPLSTYDKNTEYRVDDRDGGFTLTIYYSRYQFIPESAAVATACRQALLALAYEVAEGRGQRIASVNEQRVRLSLGRNGLTGITSCSATAPVDYAA